MPIANRQGSRVSGLAFESLFAESARAAREEPRLQKVPIAVRSDANRILRIRSVAL